MPISKRDKKVSLTKTSKKGMAMKQQLVENIRKFLENYEHVYVFTINNMRNRPLKELREEWKDSRFFFAKRSVMAMALGRTEADEVQKNIHKIASHLVGQCGLLFTNRPKDQVVQWFRDYSQMEFAKSGFLATESVVLPAGPLTEFSFSLEPHLRSLGLPTQLEKGKIILREDYTVCVPGSKLTPEQASILKLIGEKMAEFKVKLVCMWSKDGSFERFKVPREAKPLSVEKNTESQKKKKRPNISDTGSRKTEEEITQLFDQQTINEPETLSEKVNLNSEGLQESMVAKPSKRKSKKHMQNNMEDEAMVEDCKESLLSEEVEVCLIDKPTMKKANVEERVENKDTKNLSEYKTIDESKTAKPSKRKSVKNPQANTEESVLNENPEKQSLNEELEESGKSKVSPKVTRENPRRSMRTPKPIRRSPEERKQSVKELTGSSKKTKSAVKDKVVRTTRGTPRKSVSKRIFEEPEDVEMAE